MWINPSLDISSNWKMWSQNLSEQDSLSKLLCDLWQVAETLFPHLTDGCSSNPAYCSTSNHMWSTHNILGTILGTFVSSSFILNFETGCYCPNLSPETEARRLSHTIVTYLPEVQTGWSASQPVPRSPCYPLKKNFVNQYFTLFWTSHLKCH